MAHGVEKAGIVAQRCDTMWSTKYALTQGIRECEVVEDRHGLNRDPKYVWLRWSDHPMGTVIHVVDKDAFDTQLEAIADFEQQKLKRLKSLRRRCAELEALTPKLIPLSDTDAR